MSRSFALLLACSAGLAFACVDSNREPPNGASQKNVPIPNAAGPYPEAPHEAVKAAPTSPSPETKDKKPDGTK
jgi:hypothetical protein